jgi:isopentenyldiphosphate isomerase
LRRECEEEIGQFFSFDFICKFLHETEYDRARAYFYSAKYQNQKLNPDELEISQLKWFTKEELINIIINEPASLTPPSLRFFREYLDLD